MQLSKFFVALAVSCILCFCAVSKRGSERDTLTVGELSVYGRYYFNDRQQLALVSSAVHFGFSFEGKACSLYVSLPGASGHNYLQYELNGQYIKRIRIDGNS